jgi:hypothetical protein
MSIISFITPGLIPLESLTIMGLSAKASTTPIGRFGTGLKYAFAVLARHGVDVGIQFPDGGTGTLVSGEGFFRGTPYTKLALVEEPTSGDELSVTHKLPFTTQLGQDWKLWMAVRELKANTEDEGGRVIIGLPDKGECAGHTVISIESDLLTEVLADWQFYFQPNPLPLFSANNIQVFSDPTEGRRGIYSRGYLIHPLNDSLYSYNFLGHVVLSEDRLAANTWLLRNQCLDAIYSTPWAVDTRIFEESDWFECNQDFATASLKIWIEWIDMHGIVVRENLRDPVKQMRAMLEEVSIPPQPLNDYQARIAKRAFALLPFDVDAPEFLGGISQYGFSTQDLIVLPNPINLENSLKAILNWAMDYYADSFISGLSLSLIANSYGFRTDRHPLLGEGCPSHEPVVTTEPDPEPDMSLPDPTTLDDDEQHDYYAENQNDISNRDPISDLGAPAPHNPDADDKNF